MATGMSRILSGKESKRHRSLMPAWCHAEVCMHQRKTHPPTSCSDSDRSEQRCCDRDEGTMCSRYDRTCQRARVSDSGCCRSCQDGHVRCLHGCAIRHPRHRHLKPWYSQRHG